MTWNKKQLKLSKLIQADHFSLAIVGEFPMSGGVSFQIFNKKKQEFLIAPLAGCLKYPCRLQPFPRTSWSKPRTSRGSCSRWWGRRRWWAPRCSRPSSPADGSRRRRTSVGRVSGRGGYSRKLAPGPTPVPGPQHIPRPPWVATNPQIENAPTCPNSIQLQHHPLPGRRARDTRAAEPMAKPLPMAAVVLPAASRASVRRRTSGLNSAISAMPPGPSWGKLGQAGAHGAEVSRWSGPGLN